MEQKVYFQKSLLGCVLLSLSPVLNHYVLPSLYHDSLFTIKQPNLIKLELCSPPPTQDDPPISNTYISPVLRCTIATQRETFVYFRLFGRLDIYTHRHHPPGITVLEVSFFLVSKQLRLVRVWVSSRGGGPSLARLHASNHCGQICFVITNQFWGFF